MLGKYSIGYPLRLVGRTLLVVGVISAILMTGFLRSAKIIEEIGLFSLIICYALATLLSFLGLYLNHTGKKLTAKTAEEEMSKDTRNPVLYLRSFIDDVVAAKVVKRSPLERIWLPQHLTLSVVTEEELIAIELSRIGPCVAVGSPGEKLPPLGMKRMYFDHDEWEEGVRQLMLRAELIVMRAGSTPGFLWELKTAVDSVSPKKLLILIPDTIVGEQNSDSRKLVGQIAFPEAANELLPKKIPPFSVKKEPWMSLSAVVSFQSDWTPRVSRFLDMGDTVKESLEVISKRYSNYGTL
jgi:hypothetical protein